MQKLRRPGLILFSIGIIALGILSLIYKDFMVGRPPAWPVTSSLHKAIAYVAAILLIISGIAVLIDKYAMKAALLIACMIFLLSILRHLPFFMQDWLNTYKSMALFGGSLVVAAACRSGDSLPGVLNTKFPVATGSILMAVFFIASGYAHFKFADFVINFIPAYIPFHVFWTYFCGLCLFAGALGLLIPQTRSLAALLSGIMVAGWFILLHIPRFLANTNDTSDRLGLCESFTFCGIFFALAALTAKKKS